MIFFKIFGYGVNGTEQYAVLDTDLDMLCAVIGCAVGSAVLAASIKRKTARKSGSSVDALAAK